MWNCLILYITFDFVTIHHKENIWQFEWCSKDFMPLENNCGVWHQWVNVYGNDRLWVNILSLEPQGHYHFSTMFHWRPDGRYHCTKSVAITPFWFSKETPLNSVNALLVLKRTICVQLTESTRWVVSSWLMSPLVAWSRLEARDSTVWPCDSGRDCLLISATATWTK